MSLHRDRLQGHYGEFESLADLARALTIAYREPPAARAARAARRLLGSDELPPLAGLDEEE
jgi:hypothetical protein